MAKTRPSSAKKARPAFAAKTAARADAGARYETITVDVRESVALVVLSRPEVHNAFNATLIAELTRALEALDRDATVRAVVLLGEGKSFCAGADLNWMKEMAGYGAEENLADASALAAMLKTLHRLSKPTIARVHGSAFGGGAGLVACCDIAFAAHDATFSFSEAKLGLIPATIAPYVLEAIGARYARRYFLSAERFTAAEAFRIGLVHDIYPLDEIDARINELLGSLLVAGPRAQDESKALIRAVRSGPIDDTLIADTAARIARIRGSEEGREGVGAFLGKRAPAWVPRSLRKK
jgi:methylglutaconyl-CoA hydratase